MIIEKRIDPYSSLGYAAGLLFLDVTTYYPK
jgi:hypothetical protein